MVFLLIFSSTICFGGEQFEKTTYIINDLKNNTIWIQSYKYNEFDCSVQSTTLWHLLNDVGIKSLIAYSVYFDTKHNKWMDHVFLLSFLDDKLYYVDATFLEIRNSNVLMYGYYVTQIYNKPEHANSVWPNEFIKWDISKLKK